MSAAAAALKVALGFGWKKLATRRSCRRAASEIFRLLAESKHRVGFESSPESSPNKQLESEPQATDKLATRTQVGKSLRLAKSHSIQWAQFELAIASSLAGYVQASESLSAEWRVCSLQSAEVCLGERLCVLCVCVAYAIVIASNAHSHSRTHNTHTHTHITHNTEHRTQVELFGPTSELLKSAVCR